jgi:signal transduction histidine kinase
VYNIPGGRHGRTLVIALARQSRAARLRLQGRLAGLLFVGSGLLGAVTIPLTPDDANKPVLVLTAIIAIGIGVVVWMAPWERWPRSATLWLVPPAFGLIAVTNVYGGSDPYSFAVYFVVVFVWIGLCHPRWTSLAFAPLAALAYVLPLFSLQGPHLANGLGSAAVVIPVCVLVGESLSWILGRLLHTEQALAQEREVGARLRALDNMKNLFLSSASHELRTPITIVRGHLEVLDMAPTETELRETNALVIDELDRMGRLVDDMTVLARSEDPEFLRLEEVDLHDFAADVAAKAEPLLGRRLKVRRPIRGALVKADPHRLTQAVLNLLKNAADHTQSTVVLHVAEEPGWWRIEVEDRGGGIPPEDVEAIFEPFRSGTRSSGTGLGLAIVRGIAEAHGGAAGVDNQPGVGAKFWIRLPQ